MSAYHYVLSYSWSVWLAVLGRDGWGQMVREVPVWAVMTRDVFCPHYRSDVWRGQKQKKPMKISPAF